MNRRDFLKSAPAGALLMHAVANAQRVSTGTAAVARKLEPFDYQGVRLRPSRWQQQFESGRAFYLGLSNDAAMREKAITLYTEWAKTIGPDGNARMNHYPYDKVVGGLVDVARYAGHRDAIGTLTKITAHADKTFQRAQAPLADIADNQGYYGKPQEWYTLSENLFRAYQLTGDAAFRLFADVWLYKAYWGKFATSSTPADAHGVHAYSHVNTF